LLPRRLILRPSLLHHPLPFKHHLLMALIEFLFFLTLLLPLQLAAVQLYETQHWVQPACKGIDAAVLFMMPTVDRGFAQLCDDQHRAGRLVMVFSYVAMALLTSNFIYWEVRIWLRWFLPFCQVHALRSLAPPLPRQVCGPSRMVTMQSDGVS
jgi:hypothetical protein